MDFVVKHHLGAPIRWTVLNSPRRPVFEPARRAFLLTTAAAIAAPILPEDTNMAQPGLDPLHTMYAQLRRGARTAWIGVDGELVRVDLKGGRP